MFALVVVFSLVFQCVCASNQVQVSPKHLQPIKTGIDLLEHRNKASSLAQAKVDSLKMISTTGNDQVSIDFSSNPPPSKWQYSSTSTGKATLNATVTVTVSGGSGTPTGTVSFTVWFNGTNLSPKTVTVKAGGVATLSSSFGQGPNIVYVTYNGDSTYAPYSAGGYPLFAKTYTFSQTYATNELKCYDIPGMMYGIHMINYQYVPGLCDSAKYPVTDCWYSWQQVPDGTWVYVYRHWNVGTSCPESGCCCYSGQKVPNDSAGNPKYGDCYTGYTTKYGYTCADQFPGWKASGSPYWVDQCVEPTTANAPLDAWSGYDRP